jgi:two-component system, OmpR family, response regulator MtrA
VAVVAVAHSRRGAPEELAGLLAGEGYHAVTTTVRRSLVEELVELDPDVVVVDGSLADFDVMRLSRDIRSSVTSRIVVVSAPSADETWVMDALRAGADDVLEPGASKAMVRARMMAIVRRGPIHPREPDRLIVGDVVVDVEGHSVLVGGAVVAFPVRLFRTFVALARRPNAVVSCDQLLLDVWGVEPQPSYHRRVRVAVSSLRRLLGEGASRPRIETVVRVGYRLATVATPTA